MCARTRTHRHVGGVLGGGRGGGGAPVQVENNGIGTDGSAKLLRIDVCHGVRRHKRNADKHPRISPSEHGAAVPFASARACVRACLRPSANVCVRILVGVCLPTSVHVRVFVRVRVLVRVHLRVHAHSP